MTIEDMLIRALTTVELFGLKREHEGFSENEAIMYQRLCDAVGHYFKLSDINLQMAIKIREKELNDLESD
jgi:hypothetical protein